MTRELYIDLETRSEVPITHGTDRYASGEHADVLLFLWAIDDGPVQTWEVIRGHPMPTQLARALEDPKVQVVIHNSPFDRWVALKLLGIDIPYSRIIDTMVQAYAHGLPGGLAMLSQIFKLGDQGKDAEGRKYIRLFSVPDKQKSEKAGCPVFNDWETHPQEWLGFCRYGQSDIMAMRALRRKIPSWNYPNGKDRALWQLDREMNERGLPMDVTFANNAMVEGDRLKKILSNAMRRKTNSIVTGGTDRTGLLAYLKVVFGIKVPDLKAATVEALINNPAIEEGAKALLRTRLDANRTAVTKYKPVITNSGLDGRLRNTVQFMGAARTGRDAGRVFQPQNLMRPTLWGNLEGSDLDTAIQGSIDVVNAKMTYELSDDGMELLGNLVRSVICPGTGKQLAIADLSNIEGRTLTWLANEEWKLQYFRDYDAGKIKFDNYQVAYARAMNVPVESVNRYQRNIGKVMELGLGYGGGVAAFLTFVNTYRLNLKELAQAVFDTADRGEYNECKDKYEWASENGYHGNLELFEFTACEYLKTKWRQAHPRTVEFWRALEEGFKAAIAHKDTIFEVEGTQGKIRYLRKGPWLQMRLPSGRSLVYLSPRYCADKGITFLGLDGFTKKFGRNHTYSGRLSENAASGTARDVLFHALPEVKRQGYNLILRVHDELVCEQRVGDGLTHEGLAKIMSTQHDWCKDLPLAAAGMTVPRYRGGD